MESVPMNLNLHISIYMKVKFNNILMVLLSFIIGDMKNPERVCQGQLQLRKAHGPIFARRHG